MSAEELDHGIRCPGAYAGIEKLIIENEPVRGPEANCFR
jgi:hypothetical protein